MAIFQADCPWCGRMVLRDDDRSTLSHAVPECKGFRDFVAAHAPGGTTTVTILVTPERSKPN